MSGKIEHMLKYPKRVIRRVTITLMWNGVVRGVTVDSMLAVFPVSYSHSWHREFDSPCIVIQSM